MRHNLLYLRHSQVLHLHSQNLPHAQATVCAFKTICAANKANKRLV